MNERSDIEPSLYILAYRSINIEIDVTIYSSVELRPNSMCANFEAINTFGNISFETGLILGDLEISAGSINSKGDIIYRERCKIGTSVMVGGFGGGSGYVFELTEEELLQIYAPNIIIDYPSHPVQVSVARGVLEGAITISTYKNVTVTGVTTWKTVTIVSGDSIRLRSNITATAGDLTLNFTSKLEIASGVHLRLTRRNLLINGLQPGSTIISYSKIHIEVPMGSFSLKDDWLLRSKHGDVELDGWTVVADSFSCYAEIKMSQNLVVGRLLRVNTRHVQLGEVCLI